ncbi:MAG TPA: AAA family ATPase, partial [Candidatus Bathyarchaeota archaeon]|nr:AAA family ATPase [Candidatus Bathyarchaeota archaeon]
MRVLRHLVSTNPSPILSRVYQRRMMEYKRRIEELRSVKEPLDLEVEVEGLHKPASEGTRPTRGRGLERDLKKGPGISWDDIVDLEEAKRAIKEAILYPVRRPDLFPDGWPRGILL